MIAGLLLCLVSSGEPIGGTPEDIDSVPRYEAAERLIGAEVDPMNRADLVIRWFELKKKHVKPEEEGALYERLIREDELLRAKSGPAGQKISRILAWHFFEKKNFSEASKHFQRISDLNSREQLAFGDSYLNQGLLALAIAEYEKALKNLEAAASYRMGWAYLQFQDDEMALKFFDRALQAKNVEGLDVSLAAFRERVIPWMRLKAADQLTALDLKTIDDLAYKIFTDGAEAEILVAYEKVLDVCLGKDFIRSAELVHQELTKRSANPQDAFLKTAARWIKTYRARLDYENVQKILSNLPREVLDETIHGDLRNEIGATIETYETLLDTGGNQQALRPHLESLYALSFALFPSSARFERARINEAKLHLDAGDAARCLDRLKTTATDPSTEGSRILLWSRCQLDQLQSMISSDQVDTALKLAADLLGKQKIYTHFPSSEINGVRDQLGRALLSLIEKSTEPSLVEESILNLQQDSPWPEGYALRLEFQRAAENIQLRKIVSQSSQDSEKADALMRLAESAKIDDVKVKTFSNIVLIQKDERARLDACRQLSAFRSEIKIDDSVESLCIESFRDSLELEPLRIWLMGSTQRSIQREVLLGLAEVALGMEEGKTRLIENGQSEIAQLIYPPSAPVSLGDSQNLSQRFSDEPTEAELKNPAKALVSKLKSFEKIDAGLMSTRDKGGASDQTEGLMGRYFIADRFVNWMNLLGKKVSISPTQRAEFDKQLSELIAFWSSEKESRRISFCEGFFRAHPFESVAPLSCDGMGDGGIVESFQVWVSKISTSPKVLDENPQPLKPAEGMSERKRLFQRLLALVSAKSSEIRALILQDWAIEARRSDLFQLALDLEPKTLPFYQEPKRGLNPYYQRLYQMRAEYLEKRPSASASVN